MKYFLRLLLFTICVVLPSSKINAGIKNQTEEREIKNLRAFAKLYGYVRFFHPSDEASNIDWDKFAEYGTMTIINAANNEELENLLKQLFLPIAPTAQIYNSSEKPVDVFQLFPKDTKKLKVVSWQHDGVKLSDTPVLYNSIRLNCKNIAPSQQTNQNFGPFSQNVDAAKFRGNQIKLEAWVKTNVTTGDNTGHLWLRVDREDNKLGFFNNMDESPIVSPEWKKYTINGIVASDAKYIVFGGFLHGKGKAWFDDFTLYYKDTNNEWKPIVIQNGGFEKAKKDGIPDDWWLSRDGYNFELDNKNVKDGNKSLLVESGVKYGGPTKLFEKEIKIGETIDAKVSDDLMCKIPLALYRDSSGTLGKYPEYSFQSLINEMNSDLSGIQMNGDNKFVRLGDVITSWNVFQHFYPYFDVVKVDWDNVLTETLSETMQDTSADEFYDTLRKMVAKLHDGHGYVYYLPKQKIGSLPVRVDLIENKLVITASQDSLYHKGDIIDSLDGRTGLETLEETEKFVSGSTQLTRFRALNIVCDGIMGSKARLKIIRDNKPIDVECRRSDKSGNVFFNRIAEFNFPKFKKVEDGVYYINIFGVTNKEILDSLNTLSKAKGIIFDSRMGGITNNGQDSFQPSMILPYLMDKEFYSAPFLVPQIIYPDRKDMDFYDGHWTMEPKQPRIKAKIVFINDPAVVSYGESYMEIFEHYRLAEFVGDTTAGTNGNVNIITLPGGYRIMWTGMKVTKFDGVQHHLIGIQPTYPVRKTIEAVKEGKDEYLDKAIEVINKLIHNL